MLGKEPCGTPYNMPYQIGVSVVHTKENDRFFSTHHFLNFENAWVIFILFDCTES